MPISLTDYQGAMKDGGATPTRKARPVANFTADDTTVAALATIQFTDSSTNGPTAWDWNFGDGDTSTLQNPTHAYAGAGEYTVVLRASNAGGSDTETKVDYITVT